MFLHVSDCLVIHREDAVLSARLDCHIRDRKTVIHGQVRDTLTCKFHGPVQGTVYADPSDDMQNDVLAAHIFGRLAREDDLYGRRHLEPCLAGDTSGCHIRGSDAGGKCAKRAVGAGVGVSSDHHIPCDHKAFFRKQCMLDPHLSYIKVIRNIMFPGVLTHALAVFSRLDILIRDKMVHDQCDLIPVKHLVACELIHLLDRNRRCNVIPQHQVQIRLDQISRVHFLQSCSMREYFLSHCHSHKHCSLRMKNCLTRLF